MVSGQKFVPEVPSQTKYTEENAMETSATQELSKYFSQTTTLKTMKKNSL
jgi:hypothetical protein